MYNTKHAEYRSGDSIHIYGGLSSSVPDLSQFLFSVSQFIILFLLVSFIISTMPYVGAPQIDRWSVFYVLCDSCW